MTGKQSGSYSKRLSLVCECGTTMYSGENHVCRLINRPETQAVLRTRSGLLQQCPWCNEELSQRDLNEHITRHRW